jgi:predicted aminopeptidase
VLLEQVQTELKFKRKLNNAALIQYKTYHTGTEVFENLFEACGRSWSRMLHAALQLKAVSFSKSQQTDLAEPMSQAITECRSHESKL